ncbi:MAG: hypothetical protein ACO1OB_30850 [Archangium sp.]
MHKIDSDNAGPGGTWLKSDSMIPRHGTRGTANWFNSVQKELTDVIEAAGIPLQSSGEADRLAGFGGQLLSAINKLNPVKASCVVKNNGGTPVVLGSDRNVASVALVAGGGGAPARFRVTFSEPITNPISASIVHRREPTASDITIVWPMVWELTTTHLDFYIHAAFLSSSPLEWFVSTSATVLTTTAAQYDVTVISA